MMRFGISVSGSGVELLVLNNGVPVLQRHVEALHGSYDELLNKLVALVQSVAKEVGPPKSVGFAIPGTQVAATGLIKNSNITALTGHPLRQDLATRLQRPVRLANDANCFTLSEATDGAATGAAVVFGAILDHGCGGGLVVHGSLVPGRNGFAGEWGHNHIPNARPSDLPELACYCGRYGCIETYVSAPGLKHDYLLATGRSASPKQIAKAAAAGEAEAIAALERLEDRLARALASVINVLDPDCIVLGGELSRLDRIYTKVPEQWQQYIFGRQVETRLTRAKFGEGSTVRGAARLWSEDE